uniref:Reverse transcriptase RNase H-like domain-containing protein n=1 Tax=Romanomermis culicivorax TaxID=13658 RepID=A0A915ISJ0_ROMCU
MLEYAKPSADYQVATAALDRILTDHEPATLHKSFPCHNDQQKLDSALNKMTAKIYVNAPQKAKALHMLRQNRDVFSLPGDKPTFKNELTIGIDTSTTKPVQCNGANISSGNWQPYQALFTRSSATIPITNSPTTIKKLSRHNSNWRDLYQENRDDQWVIAYNSRVLNDTETRYSTTECECLTIVSGFRMYHHYVYGQKVIVRTNNKPLKWLKDEKHCNS